MRKTAPLALWLGVAASLASGQPAAPSVELKPKVVEGRVVYIELTDEAEQSGGAKRSSRQTHGLLQKTELTPDGPRVQLTYNRVAIASPNPQPFDYDSERKGHSGDAAEMDRVFSAMLGKTIVLAIGADGRASSVSGYPQLLEAVDRGAAGSQQWVQMRPMMTADVFKIQFWDKPHVLYPNRSVSPGDRWTSSLDAALPLVGSVKYRYECVLKEITQREGRAVALVEFTGTIAMPPDAKPMPGAGPISLRIQSGKMKGMAAFDVEMGEFTTQTHETELTIAGAITASGPAAQSTPALTMTQNSKSTLRVMTLEQREARKRPSAATPHATSAPSTATPNKAGG